TEYLYDDSIVDIAQEPDRVRVTFQRSRPREFDLVVGADGLHSHTRELAFGPEGPLRHDLGGHLSIFTAPDHLGLDREVLLYNTPGKLIGMYQTPRADGVKVILGLHSSAEDTIDREPVAQQRAFLKERFVDNGWETDTLLDAMDHASDFYFDSMTQIRMEDWSTGRVTLLGDAGHCASPLSGQGTSLAMVGAYVLAQELARHERVTPALQAYRVRMLPYVRANQAIAHPGPKLLAPRHRPHRTQVPRPTHTTRHHGTQRPRQVRRTDLGPERLRHQTHEGRRGDRPRPAHPDTSLTGKHPRERPTETPITPPRRGSTP